MRLKFPPESGEHSAYYPSADRYVIYGNHRDSWVHGAIDPSSGTSVMLELSRVLGRKVKQGELSVQRKTDAFFPHVEFHLCCSGRQENGGRAGQSSSEAGALKSSDSLDRQNTQR